MLLNLETSTETVHLPLCRHPLKLLSPIPGTDLEPRVAYLLLLILVLGCMDFFAHFTAQVGDV